jgi:hypothetical protein
MVAEADDEARSGREQEVVAGWQEFRTAAWMSSTQRIATARH